MNYKHQVIMNTGILGMAGLEDCENPAEELKRLHVEARPENLADYPDGTWWWVEEGERFAVLGTKENGARAILNATLPVDEEPNN